MKLLAVLFLMLGAPLTPAQSQPPTSSKNINELRPLFEKQKDPEKKFDALKELVKIYASEKLSAKQLPEAQKYADDLLKRAAKFKDSANYGTAVHHGNLVLGRVRLANNDISGAKEFLRKAGDAPASAQMASLGPNMTLAKELLERHEKESVLAYLNQCLKFWKDEAALKTVDGWREEIAAGKVPAFGANLNH